MYFEFSDLFGGQLIRDEFEKRKRHLRNSVGDLTDSHFIDTSVEQLVEEMVAYHGFERISIAFDEVTQHTSVPTNRGSRFYLRVPFKGRRNELMLRPMVNAPAEGLGQFIDGEIQFVLEERSAEDLERKFNEIKTCVSRVVESLNSDIEACNGELRSCATSVVGARKKQLDEHRILVESSPFPMKRRIEIPNPLILPKAKRQIMIDTAKGHRQHSSTRAEPEYVVAMNEYDHVLQVIGDMSKVMECSPKAFYTLAEESLRWVLLVP